MATSLRLIPIVVLILFTLGADQVQAEAVCSNTLTTGQWVACTEEATSTDDIDIDLQNGVNITTSGERDHGIFGYHQGAGDITINVTGTEGNKTITTGGSNAKGVSGLSEGKGGIDLTVTNVDITTTHATSQDANGISARQQFSLGDQAPYDGTYHVKIRVSDSQINTAGAAGISGYHDGNSLNSIINTGNLELTASNTDITTTGDFAHGIDALVQNTVGDVMITVTGGLIMTAGPYAHGIRGRHGSDLRTGKSGDLTIHVTDADIRTTYDGSVPAAGITDAYGIGAYNRVDGQGDVTVTLVNTDISTMGPLADGVLAYRKNGDGNVIVNVQGGEITANHYRAEGVGGWHDGPEGATGDVRIDLQDVTIKSNGEQLAPNQSYTLAQGVYAIHGRDGDIIIDARAGTAISTKGAFSYGLRAYAFGAGDIQVTTHDGSSITNTGPNAHGIDARNVSTNVMDDTRSITITVGGDITTSGEDAHGVRIGTGSAGFVGLDEDGYRRQTVTVNGRVSAGTGQAAGVYLSNGGKVFIGPQGSIGADSGIAILATGVVPADDMTMTPAIQPKLLVDMNLGGRRVANVIGDDWILNDGGETTLIVNNVMLHDGATGNTGRTARNGVWNVRLRGEGVTVDDRTTDPTNWVISEPATNVVVDRDFPAQDFTETRRPRPPPPPPEPEPSIHMVGERVFGGPDDEAGVVLKAGGEVYIGPEGSVGAESGIAILATGDSPKLLVDMNLDGRKVEEVIGDDWIVNDGGETTIIVNDVKLHDGETGVVTDAKAANGAFDVMIRAEGVTVDRTDPANWDISTPTAGIIVDRDFSAEDFIETQMEPEPEPEMPMFMEEYAPRAALYEALPDFLLRMHNWDQASQRLFLPQSPVWIRLLGSTGSQAFKRSTVGVDYDADRFSVEAGVNISLSDNFNIWASVHHVTGSADVSSPVNGGDIHVKGAGLAVDAYWSSENDYYATGRLSLTSYDIDLSSNTIGRLKSNADAYGHALHVEAGRRMLLSEHTHWTPRAWLGHTRISVDNFTDTVDSRVSFSNEDRFTGGLGVMVETVRTGQGGELSLRGSLDFEQKLGGSKTVTRVSGERLSAEPGQSSILLGLGGAWHTGPFKYSAQLSAREELNSGGEEYSGFINVGMHF